MEILMDMQNGKRRILVLGSFVYFHQDDHQSFSPTPNQGFIESFDDHGEEVSIRTVGGKVYRNISLHRVYL